MIGNRKKLRIAIVGSGRMGARWARAVKSNSSCELSCVLDADARTANALSRELGVPSARSIDEAAEGSDACVIAVPHTWLAEEAARALRAGLHVLVEKPGAIHSRDMQRLQDLARAKRRILMVGFNYRYFAGIAKAMELVDKNAIGPVLAVRIRHGHPGRAGYGKEWRMDPAIAGGGVLMDQGTHLIDLALWFLPAKKWHVQGTVGNLLWKQTAEDIGIVILKNEKGQIASLFASIAEAEPLFSLEVIGEKGSCRVHGLGKKYGEGEEIVDLIRRSRNTVTKKHFKYTGDAEKPLDTLLKLFFRSSRSKTLEGPGPVDAKRMLQIVERVYRIAKNRHTDA